jgi:uncharacterized membrane protein YdjX (TVP38/TMEM64 family)
MDSFLGRLRAGVRDTQVFASGASRRRFVLHLLVATVVVGGLTLLAHRNLQFLTNTRELRAFVLGFGVWAPLALVVLQALQVVLAPIPGQVLAVVAGYLFGAWWGTLYNMIGITIGSTVAFWLSRRFGRSYVERIVHEDALAKFDGIGDDGVRLGLFVFFLLPGLPDDVLCFVGGLTRLPLWQLVVIAVVGRAPAFFLVNVVGELLGTAQFEAAALLAVGILVVSAIGYVYRDRLIELFEDE